MYFTLFTGPALSSGITNQAYESTEETKMQRDREHTKDDMKEEDFYF